MYLFGKAGAYSVSKNHFPVILRSVGIRTWQLKFESGGVGIFPYFCVCSRQQLGGLESSDPLCSHTQTGCHCVYIAVQLMLTNWIMGSLDNRVFQRGTPVWHCLQCVYRSWLLFIVYICYWIGWRWSFPVRVQVNFKAFREKVAPSACWEATGSYHQVHAGRLPMYAWRSQEAALVHAGRPQEATPVQDGRTTWKVVGRLDLKPLRTKMLSCFARLWFVIELCRL